MWVGASLVVLFVCGAALAWLQRSPVCIRSSVVERIDVRSGTQTGFLANCREGRNQDVSEDLLVVLNLLQPRISDLERVLARFGSFPHRVRLVVSSDSINSNPHEIHLNRETLESSTDFEEQIFSVWIRSRFADFSELSVRSLAKFLALGSRVRLPDWEIHGPWMSQFRRSLSLSESSQFVAQLLHNAQQSLKPADRYWFWKRWNLAPASGSSEMTPFQVETWTDLQHALTRTLSELESIGIQIPSLKPWLHEVQSQTRSLGILESPSLRLKSVLVFADLDEVPESVNQELAFKMPERMQNQVGVLTRKTLTVLPSGITTGFGDMNDLSSQIALWVSCESMSIENLKDLSRQIQKVLLVRHCAGSGKNPQFRGFFREGFEKFLVENPQLPVVQVHLASLQFLKGVETHNPFSLVDPELAPTLRRDLGWIESTWDSNIQAYRVSSAIQAIPLFRTQN